MLMDYAKQFKAYWSQFFTDFDGFIELTSPDAYISRSGNFRATNRHTKRSFYPLHMHTGLVLHTVHGYMYKRLICASLALHGYHKASQWLLLMCLLWFVCFGFFRGWYMCTCNNFHAQLCCYKYSTRMFTTARPCIIGLRLSLSSLSVQSTQWLVISTVHV